MSEGVDMQKVLELLADPGLPPELCPLGSEFLATGGFRDGSKKAFVWLGCIWDPEEMLRLDRFDLARGCWILCQAHADGTTVPEVLVVDLSAGPDLRSLTTVLEDVFGDSEVAAATVEIATSDDSCLLRIDPERYDGPSGIAVAAERYFTELAGREYAVELAPEDLEGWTTFFEHTAAVIADAHKFGEISDDQRDERRAWMERCRTSYEHSYGVTL